MMLLLTCCIMGVGLVMAQSSKVTGKVLSDEDGEAIIGATVMVKGTTIGTVTDADGFFNLSNVRIRLRFWKSRSSEWKR